MLNFDPAGNTIPKTRKCIFHWHGRAWLTVWDRVKIPRYTHRLMHRKRVTCELHDSYFRLMTNKHAIPKILSGRLNYYITRWRQEVSELESEKLETSCGRESHHPAEGALGTSDWVLETSWWEDAGMRTYPREAWPPGPRLSNPGERERHTAMSGGAGEVNMLPSLFSFQLPLTHKPSNKVGDIFYEELCRSSLLLRQNVDCMYMCIYAYLWWWLYSILIWCRNLGHIVHDMITDWVSKSSMETIRGTG